ncbi:INO80 complex subunit 4 [Pleurostoma richardsiae]|uniref:INO80 complex subunit 4 n=1 Tax=Pleurostoma richardsiae TaxID=41990 RepID=A0AA38SDJ4_9PEZI|nr:INO80 complex subunit 4 [Pleurostoma richardsiae]
MAPPSKPAASSKDRRKSANKSPGLVTLTVSPDKLRSILEPAPEVAKEESPVKESNESPATSTTLPTAPASIPENASNSDPATPVPEDGTPAPSAMGPPGEGQGPKKKGVKRSAGAANGSGLSEPQMKIRGKPGPKKKQRLDDGTVDPRGNGAGGHKLGPKANQGAINAGLRALDRSGKPCRKWNKGGFQLKSFTGIVWEIPRWKAPPKPQPESTTEEGSTSASAEGSTKENKENEQVKSENSNSGGDVEMQSAPSMAASSPAPLAITAGA